MDEQFQNEQDNLSGHDLAEAWYYEQTWHEKNRILLDGFNTIRPLIEGKKNEQARNNECAKTPF